MLEEWFHLLPYKPDVQEPQVQGWKEELPTAQASSSERVLEEVSRLHHFQQVLH